MLAFLRNEIILLRMKRIRLSEEKKERLELEHKSLINGKERDRIKAVLLRSEGWTVPMISQALRRHESTIIGVLARNLRNFRTVFSHIFPFYSMQ